jgi:Plasmid pRiA4b ORF-3-like protein
MVLATGTPTRTGNPSSRTSRKVKLFRVAHEGDRIRYAYDFGDGWEHDVLVEKVAGPEPGNQYPSCVAGRRACPPEDVGGPWDMKRSWRR